MTSADAKRVPLDPPNPFECFNDKGLARVRWREGFECPHCKGDGRLYGRDERGNSYLKDCECGRMKKRLRLFNLAGIPGKFATVDLDQFRVSPGTSLALAKRRAVDFIEEFGADSRGLVFMGNPGLGKTHLAVAICKAMILDRGVDCMFVDFFQLLADIRHGYSLNVSDQEILQKYVDARILVIDELAKGRNTEWEITVLDQIIASRYNSADKVTLFTTNYSSERHIPKKDSGSRHVQIDEQDFSNLLTRQTLQERVGPRIYSRIAEMCDFVMMQGNDFRQKSLPKTQQFS